MKDIKKKIEKIIKKKMCDKGLKNCTYRQETVDAIEVLFEEEKENDFNFHWKVESSLTRDKIKLGKQFLSDLTELETFFKNHPDPIKSDGEFWTNEIMSKLQEIKAKYKEVQNEQG